MKYAGAKPGTCRACGFLDNHPREGVWIILDDGHVLLGHAPSQVNGSLVAEFDADGWDMLAKDGEPYRISRCCDAPIRPRVSPGSNPRAGKDNDGNRQVGLAMYGMRAPLPIRKSGRASQLWR